MIHIMSNKHNVDLDATPLDPLTYNRRFSSVITVPQSEPDRSGKIYVPYRIYRELKYAKSPPVLSLEDQKRRVKVHETMSRELYRRTRHAARSAAWKATRLARRVAFRKFQEEELTPAVFETDGFLPTMVEPLRETYADIAALPCPPHLPRIRPEKVEYPACVCRVCRRNERRRAAIAKSIAAREATKVFKTLVKKSEMAFQRHLRRMERRPQLTRTTMWAGKPVWSLFHDDPVEEEEFPLPIQEEEGIEEYTPRYIPRRLRKSADNWEEVALEMRDLTLTPPPPPSINEDRRKTLKKRLREAILRLSSQSTRARVALRATIDEMKAVLRASSSSPILGERVEEAIEASERRKFLKDRGPVYMPTTRPIRTFGVLKTELDGEDSNPISMDKASNVVLQEAVNVEYEYVPGMLRNLRRYCVGETVEASRNTDRWTQVDSFTWSTTNLVGDGLGSYRLPFEAIYKSDSTTQNYVLKENVLANEFRLRQYFDCDMTVRVQLNSTPFHIGQLQVGWYYLYEMDKYGEHRDNIVSLSQTNHIVVDAANANSVELKIPHRNYRSYINTYPRTDLGPYAYMGNLFIKVLSPLKTASCSAMQINGIIQIKLDRCDFAGMIPPGLVKPVKTTEMWSTILAMEGANLVRQYLADRNRDQLPNPQQPPIVVPTASGSLATGKNDVEPIVPMRIDAKSQTPHPDQSDEEFTVSSLCKRFSYVNSTNIKATHKAGDKVICLDASPVFSLSDYKKTVIKGTDCYHLPPVAVVSQLFAFWRGDLEFRLDFVASKFHQMRLWICWIPAYLGTLTYEQSLNCAGTYFDLSNDNRTVTVNVPFISDKPWWTHRYSNGVKAEEVPAPSQFCVYVANELTYNCSISQEIDVLLYVRGGSSFELSIPCQPSIGLSFEPSFKDETDVGIAAYPGYYPWYVSTWRNFESSKLGILRYGPGSDHVAQFANANSKCYYTVKDPVEALRIKFKWGYDNTTMIPLSKCVLAPIDVKDGYAWKYLAVIYIGENTPETSSKVRDWFFEKNQTTKTWVWRKVPNYDRAVDVSSDQSQNTYCDGNPILVQSQLELPEFSVSNSIETLSDCEFSSGSFSVEIDSREKSENKVTFESGPSNSVGMTSFGENHMDLKDICRRYQFYHKINLTNITASLAQVDYSFPILPQGLDLTPLTSTFQSMVRDGVIPIVLSGYRFYRGGLRFKFLSSLPDGLNYSVQVRPDRRFTGASARAGGRSKLDSVFLHGYATAVQCTSVNPIMTVEVPFYLPGNVGLLQRPSNSVVANDQLSRFVSLGELCVSVSFPKGKDISKVEPSITVMYCLADDFSPSLFQGFPPMCFIRDSKLD